MMTFPLDDTQLDETILSVAEASWKKVALIIVRAEEVIFGKLQENDTIFDLIASRVEVLVREGRLVAQGDIKNPRFSEVRKPS